MSMLNGVRYSVPLLYVCFVMVGQCLKRRVYRNYCHCTVKFQICIYTVEVFVNLAKTLPPPCLAVWAQLSLVSLASMCLRSHLKRLLYVRL